MNIPLLPGNLLTNHCKRNDTRAKLYCDLNWDENLQVKTSEAIKPRRNSTKNLHQLFLRRFLLQLPLSINTKSFLKLIMKLMFLHPILWMEILHLKPKLISPTFKVWILITVTIKRPKLYIGSIPLRLCIGNMLSNNVS